MQVPADLWPALSLASTGHSWPPATAEEAAVLIKAAAPEGLLPLLLTDGTVPQIVQQARKPFAALLRVQMQRTQLLIRALHRVAEILEGEEFALLKGGDYAFRLYAEPYLRPMGDIDLFVPPGRMAAVRERFLAAGMVQHFPSGAASRLETYHETAFTLDGVLIEPHQAFVQRARHRIDYDAIWSRRVPFAPDGVHAFRLDDADALLYQTLRMAIDHFNEPLVHYLDFYLLLERFGGDFDNLIARARAYRTERALYASFRQLSRVFPALRPRVDPLIERMLTPALRHYLDARVLPGRATYRRMSRGKELWRKFNLMDGYRERLGFIVHSAYVAIAGRFAREASRSGS